MSSSTELEQLHKKEVDLIDELQYIHEQEEALKKIVSILEERLRARPPLPKKSLQWCASPEKVRSVYSS